MKRKVVKHGPSSLTMSLPIAWIRKHNIKQGFELDVFEEKDKLVVSGSYTPPKKEITIHVPTVKDHISRIVVLPYIKGYDEIIIRYDESDVYNYVLKSSKLLMGFEIVEKNKNSCKLMNISTQLEQNFELLLGRLFVEQMTFTKELLEGLKNSKDLTNLLEYEDGANRLSIFCRRVIHTGDVRHDYFSLFAFYNLVTHLEEGVDCLREIVMTVNDKKFKLSKKTMQLFDRCISIQDVTFKIFNKSIKGKKAEIGLFRQHKLIRNDVIYESRYMDQDKYNSYICAKLLAIIELSHHLAEELFY